MPKYRHNLPQISGGTFISDGGMETTFIFHHGIELPEFAAFVLLKTESGIKSLERYYGDYTAIAQRYQVGFVLDTPTWRANRDWGSKLGFSEQDLAQVNQRAVELLLDIRDSIETDATCVVINGAIGPQADGYVPSNIMTTEEATAYHLAQIKTFAQTEADMVTAYTLNYVEEAIGLALAAQSCNMPVAISFTVETDGKLPTGDTLQQAIERTDEATGDYPAYYMINCAHPLHFQQSLAPDGKWLARIRGIKANASQKSHAELNESTELDAGNPVELGTYYRTLKNQFNHLNVLGGCCGTDHRHIEEICKSTLVS
ncbi:MAG: homocysteine S-methyltransferase family protein [Anaerolineae bacterium]|nr:homocysteine S-methyltransferase family protein [Anaerolineae bacterium]